MLTLKKQINVLIDYDNVSHIDPRQGLHHVVKSILKKLPKDLLPHGTYIAVRLYGGWYRSSQLSRRAQDLSIQISRYFPGTLSLGTDNMRRVVFVSVELARSLLIDPSQDILNTYRVRDVPSNLRPKALPFQACAQKSMCPLVGAHKLLQTGRCPDSSCGVRIADVITRHEQKLVDTMLTADLIHSASSGISDIVVVTNDDDLWPGIRTAIFLGVFVHHIHPQKGRSTPTYYSSTVKKNYSQYSF